MYINSTIEFSSNQSTLNFFDFSDELHFEAYFRFLAADYQQDFYRTSANNFTSKSSIFTLKKEDIDEKLLKKEFSLRPLIFARHVLQNILTEIDTNRDFVVCIV